MPWGIIFAILKRIWPYLVITVLVGGVFGYWHHLTGSIAELKQENQTLTTQVKDRTAERDQWIANYNDLKDGLKTQSVALDKIASGTNAIKKKLQQVQNDVNYNTTKLSTSLHDINKQDLSKLSCPAAIEYLREAARRKQQ